MYWGIAADQVGWSLYTIAPEVMTPTLLIVSEHDHTPEMQEGVRRLHREMQRSEFRVIHGAGHVICATHVNELAALMREFLQRPYKDLP